jgi:hypothetical protein
MGRRYGIPISNLDTMVDSGLVLHEIEEEDRMWQETRGEKSKHVNQAEDSSGAHDAKETAKVHNPVSQNESKSKAPAGFY